MGDTQEVNLIKGIQTGHGQKDWRFCRVVTARRQIRPDLVIVNGIE